MGAKTMTFECGMRFLTDYLQGDVYFKIHREGHNLCLLYTSDLEDMAKDYEAEHGNETLFKIARNAYGQTHDGDDTLHTIPYQPSIFGFFYNKTLFDKAGVEGVPTTWEEMDAACAKLKEAGITPITADDAYMTSLSLIHI